MNDESPPEQSAPAGFPLSRPSRDDDSSDQASPSRAKPDVSPT
jgi:hypothetical protein